MSTDVTPYAPPANGPQGASYGLMPANRTVTLTQLYKPATADKDGGWGKIKELIRKGRKVAREERLRWQENREFYRGNHGVYYSPGESQLRGSLSGRLPRSRQNSYNRLRQFIDGRVALMTSKRPPYEVIPEDRDQDSIDAANQAEKFITARWGNAGWNIAARLTELAKNADIDGISWLSVSWDPNAAESTDQLIAVDMQGQPITDRSVYEALKAEDPTAEVLWRIVRSQKPLGDVCWRVVLPAAIAVDPFAVKDPREACWVCESRIRPRSEVEARMGMTFKDAVRQSAEAAGGRATDVQYEDLAVDDGGAAGRRISEADGVVVHCLYARPCHDFPRGAHLEFADKAPNKPLVVEEWQQETPYFGFIPRPDPGNFIRSRGMADDLKPIQRDYNQRLDDLGEWMKRVARTPVALPFGSMASDSYFNEDGVFFYHAAMGEPHFSQVPAEPSAVITNDLARMVAEMRDISGISAAAQGQLAPGSPDAAVAMNMAIQQTEQNLSEFEANLMEAIEWGCNRSLKLVERFYTIPRTVTGLGVDDSEEFAAFHGAMLRGANRLRVTGPLMPRSRAARMQALVQMLPYFGDRLGPYLADLMDGNPDRLQKDIEVEGQRERNDIRLLVGLVKNPMAQKVYANLEEDKQAFAKAFNIAVQQGSQDPMGTLAQNGVTPPRITQALHNAGFELPMVEDFYRPFAQMKALDEYRMGDGYRNLHPMSKQLLRERAEDYKRAMAQQTAAMAQQMPVGQQQGSQPRQPGIPSPPKNTPQPGGMG